MPVPVNVRNRILVIEMRGVQFVELSRTLVVSPTLPLGTPHRSGGASVTLARVAEYPAAAFAQSLGGVAGAAHRRGVP
jgi:hypothetical protein